MCLFSSGDTILNNLLDWIKIHYEKAENQALVILGDKTAYFTDECVEEKFSFYWDSVIGLLLQGNIDMARMLLSNHSQSHTEPFIQAMKILKSMPTYSVSVIFIFILYVLLLFLYINYVIQFYYIKKYFFCFYKLFHVFYIQMRV